MEPSSDNTKKSQKQQEQLSEIDLIRVFSDSGGNISYFIEEEELSLILENKYALLGLFEEIKHILLSIQPETEDSEEVNMEEE